MRLTDYDRIQVLGKLIHPQVASTSARHLEVILEVIHQELATALVNYDLARIVIIQSCLPSSHVGDGS